METIDAARSQHSRPHLGLRRRPGRVALAVFRLPLVLYRHGWGRVLGRTFMLLVHEGRKTGQPHPMTAMVMRYDPTTREVVIFSGWGPDSDWVRNIRARPAIRVEVGSESYAPQHRFLSEDEGVAVASDFVRRQPYRVFLASRILEWPDLHLRRWRLRRRRCQLHAFVLELIPRGAKRDLSAAQARKLLASVRPRVSPARPASGSRWNWSWTCSGSMPQEGREQGAAALLRETDTMVLGLHGIGPFGAARLLIGVGDIARFPGQGALRVADRNRADRHLVRGQRPPPYPRAGRLV
jgi:deazaflavin-dependent oxidoreductase (nitroreductase family)